MELRNIVHFRLKNFSQFEHLLYFMLLLISSFISAVVLYSSAPVLPCGRVRVFECVKKWKMKIHHNSIVSRSSWASWVITGSRLCQFLYCIYATIESKSNLVMVTIKKSSRNMMTSFNEIYISDRLKTQNQTSQIIIETMFMQQ